MSLGNIKKYLQKKIYSLAKYLFVKRMSSLTLGRLTLHSNCSNYVFGTQGEPNANIYVNDDSAFLKVLLGGTVGAGEAYMDRLWETDDLTSVVRIFTLNRKVLDGMDSNLYKLFSPLHRFYHFLNRNTIKGSRKNISAHYDLGNEFYEMFLDSTMMYSSAVFRESTESLMQASINKLEAICRKLNLTENDEVLEIGSGWGGFAVYAAENYKCKITTTTISEEQYKFVKEKIKESELENYITVLKKDYRELEGKYDKIVSIEMIEAVGSEYMDSYFHKCSSLLKDSGIMVLQAITITDQYYRRALREVDFIQRYIFPGGFLPSVSAMADSINRTTDMKIFHLEDFADHYAQTLREWKTSFFNNLNSIKRLGYSDTFIRMWEYYFSYCEGGFAERAIGVVQMVIEKPMSRRRSNLVSGWTVQV